MIECSLSVIVAALDGRSSSGGRRDRSGTLVAGVLSGWANSGNRGYGSARVRHDQRVLSIEEKWAVTVPGHRGNRVLCDPASQAVYVGDGWGVPYAALRLHRLELSTGRPVADIRTRHQAVSALALHGDHLWAATDSRLFQLACEDLSVISQWDKGLVRYCMTLMPYGGAFLMANWRAASVGCFEPSTARTTRLKVGLQPLIVQHGSQMKAIAGFDGGISTLVLDPPKLTASLPTPPVANAAGGAHVWATLAGPPEGGQGEPPVWTRGPTSTVVRLTGDPMTVALPGAVRELVADEDRGLLWCLNEEGIATVDQHTGRLAGHVSLPGRIRVAHVDPQANLAFTLESHVEGSNGLLVKSWSTLTCYTTNVG